MIPSLGLVATNRFDYLDGAWHTPGQMATDTQVPALYVEARPKRGRQTVVNKTIFEISALFAEVYDHKANSWLRTERGPWGGWKVLITFESWPVQDMLTQDPRFQELLRTLRVNCKPAGHLRSLLYPIWFRYRKFLIPDFQAPPFTPEQPKQSD